MSELLVSVAVLVSAVLLSEAARRWALGSRLGSARRSALGEAASTFQLCCCTHELKLLGDAGLLAPGLGLLVSYTVTVLQLLTARGAACNPCGAADSVLRGTSSGSAGLLAVAGQFAAAVAARYFAVSVWSLGLSDVHAQHRRLGFRCSDPVGGSLLAAAAAEFCCACAVQAAASNSHRLNERVRPHGLAAVITALSYAGVRFSGAFFNPVLAFSVVFCCSDRTFLQYAFVYWLGPALGTASCVVLLEKLLPFLSRRISVRTDVSAVHKKTK